MVNATFAQDGLALDYIPAADVAAGDLINLGEIIGYAKRPIAASTQGSLAISGGIDVIKSGSTGPIFAIGDVVLWDPVNLTAKRAGANTTGDYWVLGTAIAAAGASDTTVRTRLNPYGIPAMLQGRVWEDLDLSGGSKTLDKEDVGKVMNVTVGHATNVITLPATVAGVSYVIRNDAAGGRVAISPNASDKLLGADLTGTDNKDRILTAATSRVGDYLAIVADAVDGWYINAERGVWVQEA